MSDQLIAVTRGSLTENIIRGSIAVIDQHDKVIASCGNPYQIAYLRSAAKPLQASAAVEAGVMERFALTDAELAIMCGSHIGADYHLVILEGILRKLGLSEHTLTLGADLSMDQRLREHRLSEQVAPRKLFNNCSGKHLCMLALCRYFGWKIEEYQRIDHPVQQLIRQTVADYAQMPSAGLVVGVDGCGVPVFGLPLADMALAYRNLANAETQLSGIRIAAAQRITDAMTSYPELVEGNGRFTTELMRTTKGRIVAKLGADGVFCAAPRRGNLAMAVKIESGAGDYAPPVVISALRQLGLLNDTEIKVLATFAGWPNINCENEIVGEVSPIFNLSRGTV